MVLVLPLLQVLWTKLSGLEAVSDTSVLPDVDSVGRVILQPGASVVAAALQPSASSSAAASPAPSLASSGAQFSYQVLVSETVPLLPAPTRVIERTEIRPEVTVVANWYGSRRELHLLVLNRRPSAVRIKLVWTAFENLVVLRGAAGELFVGPRSEAVYAVLAPRVRDQAWKYRYSFRMIENGLFRTPAPPLPALSQLLRWNSVCCTSADSGCRRRLTFVGLIAGSLLPRSLLVHLLSTHARADCGGAA